MTGSVRLLRPYLTGVAASRGSHGDFNARQLLLAPEGVAVVDFDAMCVPDPEQALTA